MRRTLLALSATAALTLSAVPATTANAQDVIDTVIDGVEELPEEATLGSQGASMISSGTTDPEVVAEGSSLVARDYVIGTVIVLVIGGILYTVAPALPDNVAIPLSNG